MPDPQMDVVRGRTFDTSGFSAKVEKVSPSHGLYQECFNLSEADFLRLQQQDPVLAAIGAVFISFGLTYLLPMGVEYLVMTEEVRTGIPRVPLYVGISSLLLGAAVLALGYFVSRERRKVVKRIREHFKNNPTQLEYRATTP